MDEEVAIPFATLIIFLELAPLSPLLFAPLAFLIQFFLLRQILFFLFVSFPTDPPISSMFLAGHFLQVT